jgi:hypothetical protein
MVHAADAEPVQAEARLKSARDARRAAAYLLHGQQVQEGIRWRTEEELDAEVDVFIGRAITRIRESLTESHVDGPRQLLGYVGSCDQSGDLKRLLETMP